MANASVVLHPTGGDAIGGVKPHGKTDAEGNFKLTTYDGDDGEVLGTYPHAFYNTDGTSQIYGFHTGGVNTLNVDGSVRFLRQTVDMRTLASAVTRNGGEAITIE